MVEVARAMTVAAAVVVDAASEHEIISLSPANIDAIAMTGFSPLPQIHGLIASLTGPAKVH